MAVTHNSNSYLICNQLFWGVIVYLGGTEGKCSSQKKMACYRTEMLNQSVASLWEHQWALKQVSVGFGSFFYSFWLLVGWLLFFLLLF